MFRTIVWATDGSESSDSALAYAKELASSPGAALHAVHGEEHITGGRSAGYTVHADEDDVEARLRAQVDAVRAEGLTASFQIVRCSAGKAPDAIADYARTVGADVIVAGTRGHSRLAGALLGSVTQGLLHEAHCPVLVVPPRSRAPRAAEEAEEAVVLPS